MGFDEAENTDVNCSDAPEFGRRALIVPELFETLRAPNEEANAYMGALENRGCRVQVKLPPSKTEVCEQVKVEVLSGCPITKSCKEFCELEFPIPLNKVICCDVEEAV